MRTLNPDMPAEKIRECFEKSTRTTAVCCSLARRRGRMRGHLRKFAQNPMPHNAHIGTITADEFAQNFSSFWHEPEEDAEKRNVVKPGTLINSLSRGDSAIIGTTIKATPTIGGGLLNSPRHSHRSRGRKPKFGHGGVKSTKLCARSLKNGLVGQRASQSLA